MKKYNVEINFTNCPTKRFVCNEILYCENYMKFINSNYKEEFIIPYRNVFNIFIKEKE